MLKRSFAVRPSPESSCLINNHKETRQASSTTKVGAMKLDSQGQRSWTMPMRSVDGDHLWDGLGRLDRLFLLLLPLDRLSSRLLAGTHLVTQVAIVMARRAIIPEIL